MAAVSSSTISSSSSSTSFSPSSSSTSTSSSSSSTSNRLHVGFRNISLKIVKFLSPISKDKDNEIVEIQKLFYNKLVTTSVGRPAKKEERFDLILQRIHHSIKSSEGVSDFFRIRAKHVTIIQNLMERCILSPSIEIEPSFPRRVIILGPGSIEPYALLLAKFDEIVCVNISNRFNPQLNELKKVKFVEFDLSGGLCERVRHLISQTENSGDKNPYEFARKIIELYSQFQPLTCFPDRHDLLGKTSLVISSLVSSQLVHTPTAALKIFLKEYFFGFREEIDPSELLKSDNEFQHIMTTNRINFKALEMKLISRMFRFHLTEINRLLFRGGRVFFADTFKKGDFSLACGEPQIQETLIIPDRCMDDSLRLFDVRSKATWVWSVSPQCEDLGFLVKSFLGYKA